MMRYTARRGGPTGALLRCNIADGLPCRRSAGIGALFQKNIRSLSASCPNLATLPAGLPDARRAAPQRLD